MQTALLGKHAGTASLGAFGAVSVTAGFATRVFNFLVDGVSAKTGKSVGLRAWSELAARVRFSLLFALAAGCTAAVLLAMLIDPISIDVLKLKSDVMQAAECYWWLRVCLVPITLINMSLSGILQGFRHVRLAAIINTCQALVECLGSFVVLKYRVHASWHPGDGLFSMGIVTFISQVGMLLVGFFCILTMPPPEAQGHFNLWNDWFGPAAPTSSRAVSTKDRVVATNGIHHLTNGTLHRPLLHDIDGGDDDEVNDSGDNMPSHSAGGGDTVITRIYEEESPLLLPVQQHDSVWSIDSNNDKAHSERHPNGIRTSSKDMKQRHSSAIHSMSSTVHAYGGDSTSSIEVILHENEPSFDSDRDIVHSHTNERHAINEPNANGLHDATLATEIDEDEGLLDFVKDGLNMFIRSMIMQTTFFVTLIGASRLGTPSLAAHSIVNQLWILISYAVDGFAAAGIVLGSRLVAQAHDALLAADAKKHLIILIKKVLSAGLIAGVAAACVFGIGRERIIAMFTNDADIIGVLRHHTWTVLVLSQPLNGCVFVYDGLMYASQSFTFIRNYFIVGFLIVFCPLMAIQAEYWQALWGIWLANAATNLWRVVGAAYLIHWIFMKEFDLQLGSRRGSTNQLHGGSDDDDHLNGSSRGNQDNSV